jgi:hypothetical protein
VGVPVDTTPPQPPQNPGGIPDGATAARIEWTEPDDDVGVTRYEVYRDGQFLRETPLRYFVDTLLQPRTSYTYTVKARDGSANLSPASAAVKVTTLEADGGLVNGDFEIGLATPLRWANDAFTPSAQFAWSAPGAGRGGGRCIRILAEDQANDARWVQEVSGLVPGGRYRLSGWIRGKDITLAPGATIGASLCAMGGWDRTAELLSGSFDWTPVECIVFADAAGRVTMACRLGFWGSLASGSVWFDDLRLTFAPAGASLGPLR